MSKWQPGQVLQLETNRFWLRSMTESDVSETYVSWWNDAEIQAGLGNAPRAWGFLEAKKHVASFDNASRLHLGIFPKDSVLPIGFITLLIEPGSRAKSNTVIGNKNYWGEGVVLEIRDRALRFLFDDMGMAKVFGVVDARNFASIFNYKAQGFVQEAVMREHVIGPDGERHDQVQFSLLRREWEARRAAAGKEKTAR